MHTTKMSWAVVIFLFVQPVFGETVTGSINGNVVDPSGQTVPAATVTLTHEILAARRTATTDATGGFVFNAVLAGAYTLEVEKGGFKRYRRAGIHLAAAERLALRDIALEIGSTSESSGRGLA